MALVGIQALSYMNHHVVFLCFSKINLQNFSFTWKKINNSSDLLISYPSITQTQIKHMLPTSFKFRVNPYIKIVLSKTWGEFKAKNQVLERNYNRATIHHFYLRDYLESSLFYSDPKNKLKQTRHTYLFCFHSSFFDYLKETKIITKGKVILTWIHRGASPPSQLFW